MKQLLLIAREGDEPTASFCPANFGASAMATALVVVNLQWRYQKRFILTAENLPRKTLL